MNLNNSILKKCYVKLFFLFVILMFFSSSVIAMSQEEIIEKTLNDYYFSFSKKNLDSFLSLQVSYDENVKEIVERQFDSMTVLSYSLSDFETEVYENVAFVEYYLQMKVLMNNKIVSFDEDMKAILVKKDFSWKILAVGQKNLIDETLINLRLKNLYKNISVDKVNFKEKKDKPLGKSKRALDLFVHTSCGDGICELGEVCAKDCNGFSYTSECRENCSDFETIELYSEKKSSCNFDDSTLNFNSKKLEKISFPNWIVNILAKNVTINLKVESEGFVKDYYFNIFNNTIRKLDFYDNKVDYIVRLDSCTFSSIQSGDLSLKEAYSTGKIVVEGNNFNSKIKTFFTNIFFNIFSWFEHKPVFEYVEGESGVLVNRGRYSFMGPSVRGHGELYLGSVNSKAVYNIKNNIRGKSYVYIKISDDGKHKDGSRSVNFVIGNTTLYFDHKSENYESNNSYWKWIYLGESNIDKGNLRVEIIKPEQTSAAFIMDKFLITNEKININLLK